MSSIRTTAFLICLAATLMLGVSALKARQLQHQEFRVAVAMGAPVRLLAPHRSSDADLQRWFAENEALRDQALGLYRLLAVLTSIAGAGMLASLMLPKLERPA